MLHVCLACAVNAGPEPDRPALPRDPKLVALAREHYAKRKPVIAKFQSAIDRHLAFAKHETLRNLETHANLRGLSVNAKFTATNALPGGVGIDIMFDKQRFADGLLIAIRNEAADALQVAGNQLLEELGITQTDPWSMPDPVATGFIDTRQNLLRDVPDEIWNTIRDEVSAGVENGESIAQLSKRITETIDGISRGRAVTIASTETGAAYGFSRQYAMKDAGVKFKRWLTSHLPNVRLAHAIAEKENTRVPFDDPFVVGGEELMFPGDEHGSPENTINCHCVALATA
jgi:hypothetical protein